MDLFARHGVTEVLVNLHHLPEQVRDFLANTPLDIDVHLFHEPELLGSGGTVAANRDFVQGEDTFLVCYADNLTNIDLSRLLEYHAEKESPFTMAVFHAAVPEQCGIVEMDSHGLVERFVEKPSEPRTDLANGGIYVATDCVFDHLPDSGFSDFGYDVLPKMVGLMYGYVMSGYHIDIGTLESYEQAQREWCRLTMSQE